MGLNVTHPTLQQGVINIGTEVTKYCVWAKTPVSVHLPTRRVGDLHCVNRRAEIALGVLSG